MKVIACIISYLGEKDKAKRLQAHINQLEWLRDNKIQSYTLCQNYSNEELAKTSSFVLNTNIVVPFAIHVPKARNFLISCLNNKAEWLMMLDDDTIIEHFKQQDLNLINEDIVYPLFEKVDKGVLNSNKMEPGKRLKGSAFLLKMPNCKHLRFDEDYGYAEDVKFGIEAMLSGKRMFKCHLWNVKEFGLDETSVFLEQNHPNESRIDLETKSCEQTVQEYGDKGIKLIADRRLDFSNFFLKLNLKEYNL